MNENIQFPIERAVAQATTLLDQWRLRPDFADAGDAIDRMGLAVREWFSMLLRFTEFYGEKPRLRCSFFLHEGRLISVIADNSDGLRLSGATWGAGEGRFRARDTSLLYLQLLTDSATYRREADRNILRLEVNVSAAMIQDTDPRTPFTLDLREHLRSVLLLRQEAIAA